MTALALTRDQWERRFAQSLVSADVDLNALASSLGRDAASRVAVGLPASYAVLTPPAAPVGEAALAYLVAQAARGADRATFNRVTALRTEGGSWGVVAALVGADVSAVSVALDRAVTPVDNVLALGGGGTVRRPRYAVRRRPRCRRSGWSRPSRRPGQSRSGAVRCAAPQPSRSPVPIPVPVPDPARPVVDLLQAVVEAVVSALPAPVASLLPRPQANTQTVTPAPSPTSGVRPLVGSLTSPLLGSR